VDSPDPPIVNGAPGKLEKYTYMDDWTQPRQKCKKVFCNQNTKQRRQLLDGLACWGSFWAELRKGSILATVSIGFVKLSLPNRAGQTQPGLTRELILLFTTRTEESDRNCWTDREACCSKLIQGFPRKSGIILWKKNTIRNIFSTNYRSSVYVILPTATENRIAVFGNLISSPSLR